MSEGRLDEAVGRVTQEVPEQAGVGGGRPLRGEAHLGGVGGQVVGWVQVEVRDVPEPAWMDGENMGREENIKYGLLFYQSHQVTTVSFSMFLLGLGSGLIVSEIIQSFLSSHSTLSLSWFNINNTEVFFRF